MATVPDSTQDIFDAFRAAGTDADLAHKACESIRNQAGQNVIAHVDARFDTSKAEVDARFDVIDARFDVIDARFDTSKAEVDARFDVIDARFDVIDARFDVIDARFDTSKAEVNARFDILEGQVTALATLINRDHLILLGIVATAVIGGGIAALLFP